MAVPLFSDLQRNGLRFFMNIDSTSDCNARNSYWNETLNMSQYYILRKLGIFWGLTQFITVKITSKEIRKFQKF